MEPNPFYYNTTQAHEWLSILKYYFIVVGFTYAATKAADAEAVYQYTVVLMSGNAARWMDSLEV